ncbi:MAG: sigma 54-interacting transcriptional regulator [Deltaproteobacteria bacterium]|nr:sigma 54-interacting transcriptional regulator [Deltaproteobacteria bacterium]
MPTLTTRLPNGELLTHRIAKSITTIGADSGNDVVIPAAGLEPHHAQIVFDGREFSIARVDSDVPVEVNGKARRKARLGHEDRIRVGDANILFSMLENGGEARTSAAGSGEIEGLRRLHAFSAKMMGKQSIEALLEELMDAVIDLTGAAKGFLVLFEGDRPDIKVARNVHKENLDNAVSELSDSIIARVVETEEPVIVSDALNDAAFGHAESVVNLRLNSVMCVPLRERGRLMGLIYVGNDRVKDLFDMRSLELLTVFASQASLLMQNAMLVDDLKVRAVSLSAELERQRFGEIVGTSQAMREVFRQVEKVAGAEVSVLIGGETGTGKELIAREIHRRSARARGPFVSVNCGAIPESLMESEFFGHMRGAFTGAVATTPGKFQSADHGTIFLDEIGEMPLGLQVKLLRVLQEHTVMKVGGTKHESLDIRVVAASNRNLEEEVKAGRFREDLYYRLNVVHVDLPALRKRDDDIVLLARYLLARYAAEFKSKVKGFTPNAVISMRKHPWPGNVRELENRLKKAVILCDGAMISAQDLDLTEDALPEVLPLAEAKERFQREYVLEVLARNNGNRTKTAKDLDVDPRTIFRYLEKA